MLSDGFAWVQADGRPALVCRALQPAAAHLFTTRPWTLGSSEAASAAGWAEVAHALGVQPEFLVRVHQVHGASTVVVRARSQSAVPADDAPGPDANIIISDDPARAIAIQTADCVPLLMADRRRGTVAAAHTDWRGLAAAVPQAAVAAMAREFGSASDDLVAAIDPSISAARYEVGPDMRERFEHAGFAGHLIERWFSAGARPDRWWFDSWQSARDQLVAAGIATDDVHTAGLCTATHADLLCSYRRDGKGAGRIAGVIRPLTFTGALPRAGRSDT